MKMRAVTLFIVLLTGCAAVPTNEEVLRASIGAAPSRSFAETAAKEVMERSLKDPESARFRFGDIAKGWYQESQYTEPRFAWMLAFAVNAKNSFGGYTGEKLYRAYFLGDRMVALVYADSVYGSLLRVEEINGGGLTRDQLQAAPGR